MGMLIPSSKAVVTVGEVAHWNNVANFSNSYERLLLPAKEPLQKL